MMRARSAFGGSVAAFARRRQIAQLRTPPTNGRRSTASFAAPESGRESTARGMRATRDGEPEWPEQPDEALIAELIARHAASSPDHAIWRDTRFLEWLAEVERDGSNRLAREGRQMLARAYCRELNIHRLSERPTADG